MKFISNFEVRGSTSKITDKGVYSYISLEDDEGESLKFPIDNTIDLKHFKKGDRVKATINYNSIYKSLKVVNLEVIK